MSSATTQVEENPLTSATLKCDVCQNQNIVSKAVSYCSTCSEYLCQTCDIAHRGSKIAFGHTILTGTEMPHAKNSTSRTLPTMYCENHKSMITDVYCLQHDKVVCGTCKIIYHGKCNTTDITQQTFRVNIEGTFNRVLEQLQGLQKEYASIQKLRLTDKNTVYEKVRECQNDVRSFRKEIDEKLDEIEKRMSDELADIENKMIKEIDNHITITDDAITQINDKIKTMMDCLETTDDDVMFVGMKKAKHLATEYETSMANLQREIYPVEIRFRANETLVGMVKDLKTWGVILKEASPKDIHQNRQRASILNKSVGQEWQIDVGSKNVCGATFMPSGHLVLGCLNDGLRLLDSRFVLQSVLNIRAVSVATLNETDVVVSQGSQKQLLTVKMFPRMAVEKVIKLDKTCVGVDTFQDSIYLTCHNSPGDGEVLVISKEGKLLRKLGTDNRRYMFMAPNCVKVSADGTKIFVSDAQTNAVSCLDRQGRVLYTYSNQSLKLPHGLYVDGENNFLVCGKGSRNLHMVRNGGVLVSLISEPSGKMADWSIAYREADQTLVIGMQANTKRSLTVFKMDEQKIQKC